MLSAGEPSAGTIGQGCSMELERRVREQGPGRYRAREVLSFFLRGAPVGFVVGAAR